MGLFLNVVAVVGESGRDVGGALTAYARACDGTLERRSDFGSDGTGLGVTEYRSGAVVTCPSDFIDPDDAARFLSERLSCATLAVSVYDGDYWSYVLFDSGRPVHGFWTIPDYFGDDSWDEKWTAGNVAELAALLPTVTAESIERYLLTWNDELSGSTAYPDDEFSFGDVWQFTDFLTTIGLGWPIDETGAFTGDTYDLTVNRRYYPDEPA